jgi:hypothetical protein
MSEIKPIQVSDVNINGPNILPTIDRPVIQSTPQPVVRGLELPIIQLPDAKVKYPVIQVPTEAKVKEEKVDAPVKSLPETQQKAPQEEKSRELPDSKPPPQLPSPAQIPATTPPIPQIQTQTQTEIPANTPQPTFTFNGVDINLPDPSIVATAGSVAVVTTAATVASTAVFNALKNAAEPLIREAAKNKFKIKIKQVKPVLHYVLTDSGKIDIFEYSTDGTKLIDSTDNVENYIRAQVETNSLYEIENKIIIDDVIGEKFTKEGQKRFKPLFAPAKKIAKKLSARLSF